MKISIVTPAYNAEKYIENLIKSVLEQSHNNYELIIVDDGSTDDTYETIKKWHQNDKRIKVYTKQNEGPALARKYGLKEATGDLIFFVDADDWINSPYDLKDIAKIMEDETIDVLFIDILEILGKNKKINTTLRGLKSGKGNLENLNMQIPAGLGSKIFRKSKLKEDFFVNSKVYEDLYVGYRYLDYCNNYYYLKKPIYVIYHEENSNSLSNLNNINNNINTHEKATDIIYQTYNDLEKNWAKKNVASYMPYMFLLYIKNILKRKYKSTPKKLLNEKIKKIVEILKKEKIMIQPTKHAIFKKIIYKTLLNIYHFFTMN